MRLSRQCTAREAGAVFYFFSLGNARVTFSDEKGDEKVDIQTEIQQINHYYAFGLNMEGNWNGAAGANKYQYNGKEWQEDLDLGWNDYGARFYDPAMARWTTTDPLAELYVQWSPYNYVLNNPINYIDLDGRNVFPPQDPKPKPNTGSSRSGSGSSSSSSGSTEAASSQTQQEITNIYNAYAKQAEKKESNSVSQSLPDRPSPLVYTSGQTTGKDVLEKLMAVVEYSAYYNPNGDFKMDAYFQGFPNQVTLQIDDNTTITIDGTEGANAFVDLTTINTTAMGIGALAPVTVTAGGIPTPQGTASLTVFTDITSSSGISRPFSIAETKNQSVNGTIPSVASYYGGRMRCNVNAGFQAAECWNGRSGRPHNVPRGWRYPSATCAYPPSNSKWCRP